MNRRWEETTHYTTYQVGGETFIGPSSAEGCTVDDEICSKCGDAYQSRGVIGGLREIMFGKVCHQCEPPCDEEMPMTKPKIDRTVTRIELYTLYELQCKAMENNVHHQGKDKQELFDHLDKMGLLPY